MVTPNRQQYGFGMTIQGEGAARSFGHGGGAPGQNGDLRVFPESGYIVVALSNVDPPAASRLVDYIAVRLPPPATPQSGQKPIVVDDFESGSLSGWTIERRGSGGWFVYQNGRQAPDPQQSDRARTQPTAISFDVSRWAGRTVSLRLASADNQGPMRAGVDDIQLVPLAR